MLIVVIVASPKPKRVTKPKRKAIPKDTLNDALDKRVAAMNKRSKRY
ncbi:MAG: hypothetical protein K8U57_15875 [Planctomycetes bacterium]|nr:hypothetical protein [Planctomycetota bacterium]